MLGLYLPGDLVQVSLNAGGVFHARGVVLSVSSWEDQSGRKWKPKHADSVPVRIVEGIPPFHCKGAPWHEGRRPEEIRIVPRLRASG